MTLEDSDAQVKKPQIECDAVHICVLNKSN